MCDCFVFRQKTAYEMRISDWSSDVCSSDLDADRVVEGLGVDWRTLDIAIKPYPACRFAHAAVDALIGLRHQHHLELNQIRSEERRVGKECVSTCRSRWSAIHYNKKNTTRSSNCITTRKEAD